MQYKAHLIIGLGVFAANVVDGRIQKGHPVSVFADITQFAFKKVRQRF